MDAAKLQALSLFDGLTPDELERCASMFQEGELLAGSGLAREGDFAYKFFVVLEGEVEILRDFEHVATLSAGDFFGEMGLISGERRNARVVAKTRCSVAWVMPWDFETLTNDFPAVSERIDQTVAERMGPLSQDS